VKEIKINCETKEYVAVDELQELQGRLKRLDKIEKDKLKKNFIKNGINFPIFVWKNKIIDGHQRVKVLRELKQEGYKITKIPVVRINAKSEKEAKEKIILANQMYGKASKKSWYEFFLENNISIDEFKDIINVSELKEIVTEKDEVEVEIPVEILEEHNYIIFYFDNKLDWEQVKNVFNIKAVSYKYHTMPHHGVARVLMGKRLLEVINGNTNNNTK